MSEDRELQCPQCDSPFEERDVEGVTIDYCILCGGVWLDPGELQELTGYKRRHSRTESTTSTHDDDEVAHLEADYDEDDDDDEGGGGIVGFVADAITGGDGDDGFGDGDGGGGFGGGGDGGGGGGGE